jgi:hypothetical protein
MYSPGHNMSTEPFNTRVTHDVVCVLYAQSTGQIIFVHRVVTLGDAQPQRDEEIEAERPTDHADDRGTLQAASGLRLGRSHGFAGRVPEQPHLRRGLQHPHLNRSTESTESTDRDRLATWALHVAKIAAE